MLPLLLLACVDPAPDRPKADTAPPTVATSSTGATTSTTPTGTEPTPTDTGGPVDTAPQVDTSAPDDPPETVPGLVDVFSHASGFVDAPFELGVTPAFDGATVVCSTDGSAPAVDGPPCDRVWVDRTMVVRATVVSGGVAAIGPLTRTFVLPDTVPDQVAPAGYPDQWWVTHAEGPYVADYGMDPDVWAAPGADVPAAVRALPVLSLVVDPDDLFGPDGIHENPLEHGAAFEKAGHVELLAADGGEDLAVGAGVRIHGGSGRRPDRSPKKSFRLLFKSEYGPTELDYPLFPGEPERFNTLVLRAGYNRAWNNWQASQRARSQYMRERFAGDLLRDMGHLVPRARYVHLLLNGLYWGVYLVQERPDAAMQAEHEGGVRDDWDALNSGEVVDGDAEGWDRLFALAGADLSDPEACAAVLALLEQDRFIEYMLVNLALGNIDWPEKNWWAGRNRAEDGPFRFYQWDSELILVNSTDDRIDDAPEGTPGWLFQRLRANEAFVRRFGDLAHRHLLAPGGLLRPEAQVARWVALADEVKPSLEAESARWGDHWRDDRADPEGDLYTVGVHWEAEYSRLVDGFLALRHGAFLEDLRAAGLYPSVGAPVPELEPGAVPAGTEVALVADDPVWHTVDGSDPIGPDGLPAPGALTGPVRVDADVTVLARALSDAGEWSALLEAAWTVE